MEEEDDIDIGESPYCSVCGSCGEEGCCSVEKSLLGHDCKYGKVYARDVYFNEMIIEEFHKLFNDQESYCAFNKPGDVVKSPIELVYDNAWNKTLEKYGKRN